MAKLYRNNQKVPWITNEDEEDFFASIGDYKLRVEQMDDRHWWWRVTYKDDPIPTPYEERTSCRSKALQLCEGVYFGHSWAIKLQSNTYLEQQIKKNQSHGK